MTDILATLHNHIDPDHRAVLITALEESAMMLNLSVTP